jgi:hypothetical protein
MLYWQTARRSSIPRWIPACAGMTASNTNNRSELVIPAQAGIQNSSAKH